MKQLINVLLFSVLLLSACKTKEKISKQPDKLASVPSLNDFKFKQPAIKSANFSKMNAQINLQGNSVSTNASIKLIRDSIIQISIQPAMGIEMARVDFNKRDIVVVDKFNGRYFKTDYGFIFSKFKIKLTYTDIQSILLNELFISGETVTPIDSLVSMFSQSLFPDGLLLKSKPMGNRAPTEFIINKENQLNHASITMPLVLTTCRYSNFVKQNNINFPFNYKIVIHEGPKISSTELTIQAVEFNTSVKINATNLSNYEQVDTFEQLIP